MVARSIAGRYGPSGSGRARTRIVGCSPDKRMLLISSSHDSEKQTAIKPRARASCDRVFISMNRNEESSLPGITSAPSISRHAGTSIGCSSDRCFPRAGAESPASRVTAWAGPALVSRAVREERGQIYSAPEVLETTSRYNENDGVSKREHEPAFRQRSRRVRSRRPDRLAVIRQENEI